MEFEGGNPVDKSKPYNRSCTGGLVLHSLLGACLTLSASVAGAEDAAAVTEPAETVEEVIVTGSLLPTTPDAVAVPVTTIDAEQMAQEGINSNALEILRKAVPAFAGRSNAGNSNANNNNQNTGGGSQLQLRNLPTLVLIDGRRVANSGIGGLNGKNFVDVNQIPAAALDHVEVLSDGASSIYGSDAIGGVVNFITKSEAQGVTIGGRSGTAAGDYGERSAYVSGGTRLGPVQFTATGSFSRTDPLYQDTRSFTSPLYGKSSGIPGVVAGGNALLAYGLNSPDAKNPVGANAVAASLADLLSNGTYLPTTPGAISAAFDVSPYQTLLLKQAQDSFVASLSSELMGKKLEVFGDVMITHTKAFTQWLPVAATGNSVPAGAPFNPLTTSFAGVTFAYQPFPHQFIDDSHALRVTAGLRGEFGHDWSWESAVVYSKSDLDQQQTNLIYKPNLALAMAGGFDAAGNVLAGGGYSKVLGGYSLSGPLVLQPALDPFARTAGVNPASLANLYGSEYLNGSSRLTSFDVKLVGNIYRLPAGELTAAVGGSVRSEKLGGHADANGRVTDPVTGLTTGEDQEWLGGTYADPFSKSRSITGLFAEFRIPLAGAGWNVPGFRAFDLIGAARWENYSDAGSSTVPKIGFRWQPFDRQLTVRGNYSKSFSAPPLFAEYGPTDTRQVGAGVIQGVFGPNYSGMPINGEDGNNPNLKPAKSTSKTLGLVFKPDFVKGLSLAADYSDIELDGFAGGLGFNNVLSSVNALGSASPYFNALAIGNFPGAPGATQPFTHPGDLLTYLTNPVTGKGDPVQANNLYLVDFFRNLATLIEHSYTMSADYTVATDRMGTLSVGTTGAVFDKFSFQAIPGQAFIEYAGHSNNTGVFGGTLPKYRFYSSFNWSIHDWDVTVGNTYISSTTDTGANGTSTPEIPVSSYTTWDFRVGYDWHSEKTRHLRIAFGVNNIGDRMPPLAPRAFLDNNADVATFSPIGRLVYGTLSIEM
jgi:iron complex outermembrane receptor protein